MPSEDWATHKAGFFLFFIAVIGDVLSVSVSALIPQLFDACLPLKEEKTKQNRAVNHKLQVTCIYISRVLIMSHSPQPGQPGCMEFAA